MRRGVLPTVGSEIVRAERPPCRLRPILLEPAIRTFDRRVRGQQIVDIGRRGKRVMIHLKNRNVIVIEPRMTGLVLLADPPGPEHLRLRLSLSGGAERPTVVLGSSWTRNCSPALRRRIENQG